MMRGRIILLASFISLSAFFSFGEDGGGAFVLDGFEDGNFWKTATESGMGWKESNAALECGISGEWSTEGKRCGVWTYGEMKDRNSQAGFVCLELFEPDWGKYSGIRADFYNCSDRDITVNVAFMDREKWRWTVCGSCVLAPGENRDTEFSLVHELTDAKNIPAEMPAPGNELYCAVIQVIGKNGGGTLLVDNIRLLKRLSPE